MVFLLGISHAGYLATKAVPHSVGSDTPSSQAPDAAGQPSAAAQAPTTGTTASDDDAIG